MTADGTGYEATELGTVLQDVLRLAALARPALARDLGIGVNDVWALEYLMGQAMGPVELSRHLDMTSAAATVLVHRLEAAGHVTREPHTDDRRRTVLHPTGQAIGAVMAVLGPMLADLDAAAAVLDDRERAVVLAYLRRVADALRRAVERPEHEAPIVETPRERA